MSVVEGLCSGLMFSCSGLMFSVLSKVCCCESGIGRNLSIVGASVGRGIAVVTGAMAGVAVL